MDAEEAAAMMTCVPCNDDTAVADGAGVTADTTSSGSGSPALGRFTTPATAMMSRRVPPSAGRRGLRQCRDSCVHGVPAALQTAARVLNFCGHAPFCAALSGGYIERALWLYRASFEPGGGGVHQDSPMEMEAEASAADEADGSGDNADAAPAAHANAAEATGRSEPADPAGELRALARSLAPMLEEGKGRVVQLLLLLGAQTLLPEAGAKAQMEAARSA